MNPEIHANTNKHISFFIVQFLLFAIVWRNVNDITTAYLSYLYGGQSMNANELINYMESLRYERNVTQEKYLNGIVSNRQYYRYRNNESEAPFDIVERLAERLGIPILRMIASYQEEQQKERMLVRDYVNFVIHQRLDEADSMFEQLRSLRIIEEYNRRFVQLGKQLSDYHRKRLSKVELVTRIKEIISISDLMKKTSIHDIELYMLGVLMQYSDEDRHQILEYIISMYRNQKLMTGGNPIFLSQVYFWMIKNLGREQRFEEVVEFCDRAIEHNHRFYLYYAMEYFYYFRALSFYKRQDDVRFHQSMRKTIEILPFLSEEKRNRFREMVQKDLGIDTEVYFKETNKLS